MLEATTVFQVLLRHCLSKESKKFSGKSTSVTSDFSYEFNLHGFHQHSKTIQCRMNKYMYLPPSESVFSISGSELWKGEYFMHGNCLTL